MAIGLLYYIILYYIILYIMICQCDNENQQDAMLRFFLKMPILGLSLFVEINMTPTLIVVYATKILVIYQIWECTNKHISEVHAENVVIIL